MPESMVKLAAMVSDPDMSAREITAVVEDDQALTSNVLRVANSVFSGSMRKIINIRDAVVRIGYAHILRMAVGEHIHSLMNKPIPMYGLGEHELWLHSVGAAIAAENLEEYIGTSVPGISFTAALLHDIGKLILSRNLERSALNRIEPMMKREEITWLDSERCVLGTDHAELGSALARMWGFPYGIVFAIANHHKPDDDPHPIQDVVHIADIVAKLIGVGGGRSQMNLFMSTSAASRLGLTEIGLEALCAKVKIELDEKKNFFMNNDTFSEYGNSLVSK
jgi:putative nucleotidyltransferase with HDIG domain